MSEHLTPDESGNQRQELLAAPEMETLAGGLVGAVLAYDKSQLQPEVGVKEQYYGVKSWGMSLEMVTPVYVYGTRKVLGMYLDANYSRLAGRRYYKKDGLVLEPARYEHGWKGHVTAIAPARLVPKDEYDQAYLDRLEATNRAVDTKIEDTTNAN